MPRYSIVVPVYNSQATLPLLYQRVKAVFERIDDAEFELVLVDDCSRDQSFATMEDLHRSDPRVKAIALSKNFGQHRATLCGLTYSTGDFVATMDDDLQHPPEELPKLIDYMREHPDVDVVVGNYISKKHGPIRNLGTRASNWLTSRMFHKRRDLHLTSFRLMRRYVVEAMCATHVANPRIGHLLLQVTNHIENTTVRHDPRQYGKSNYTFGRLAHDLANNLISNSDLPLSLLGKIGLLSFFASIALAAYYAVRYVLFGISVQGFTTLAILQLLFGGLILLGMGLIGRYMIQLNHETKKLPSFVVRREEVD